MINAIFRDKQFRIEDEIHFQRIVNICAARALSMEAHLIDATFQDRLYSTFMKEISQKLNVQSV